MARPCELTETVRSQIADSIGKGVPPEVAALTVGVSPRTYYRWCAQGRADDLAGHDTAFCQFWQAVEGALALCEATLLETVQASAAPPTGSAKGAEWRAATWILERRFPRRYGEGLKAAAQQEEHLRGMLQRVRAQLGDDLYSKVIDALDESHGSESDPG
jgi:hypothetical protein